MKKIKVYILLTVLVTMLMMFSLCFMICQYTMDAENHARYVGIMNVTSEKIATTISGMEMNAIRRSREKYGITRVCDQRPEEQSRSEP